MHLITRRSFMGTTGAAFANMAMPAMAEPAGAALVVGISSYENMPALPSAVLDASLMAVSFKKLGLTVSLLINSSKEEFLKGLAAFQVKARAAPLTVIYVAAHGGLAGGQSFMFMKDAQNKIDRIPETTLLQSVNDTPRQKIMFLDCCREVAAPGNAPPIAMSQYRAGVHVSYATQPDAVAFDGGETYSPFALALQKTLEIPGLDVTAIAQRVRLDVIQATQGQQIPWERSSLLSPVVLNPGS